MSLSILNKIAALFAPTPVAQRGRRIPGTFKVRDTAIGFRMAAGYPGDVNRSHPVSIEPCPIDTTNPPTAYGQLVVGNPTSQGVRAIVLATAAADIAAAYGFTARPFPTQQTTGGLNAAFGAAVAPTNGVIDVMKTGYMMVKLSGTTQPTKFAPVYIWNAASTGAHVLGGPEAVSGGASTTLLPNCFWNGPTDAAGVGEIIFND